MTVVKYRDLSARAAQCNNSISISAPKQTQTWISQFVVGLARLGVVKHRHLKNLLKEIWMSIFSIFIIADKHQSGYEYEKYEGLRARNQIYNLSASWRHLNTLSFTFT